MQWSKPKSVRQIGEIPGRNRIYMEDYVIRFARKLAAKSRETEKGAVLLGNIMPYNGEKIYQISGIVEIPGFATRQGPALSQEVWESVYQEIKENFTDVEIVGWFFSRQGFSVREATQLVAIHRQNFEGQDKVLYIYEETEKDDSFFLYRGGQFERQKGYYVYYEKNPEMLHYMEEEENRHIHIVEQEDDRVIRNIRGIMAEKEKTKQKKKQHDNRLGYSLGALIAMIAIVIGAASLKNQNTLNQVKEQMQTLQELAIEEQNKSNTTTVETMGNNLVRVTAQPSASAAAVSQSAVAK